MKCYAFQNLFIFPPLARQPNSGLRHFHETSRFTSVIRSRTVGRTPWTSAELKASTHTQTQKNSRTTETLNIHAQSGIRTDGFCVHASEDSSCLRPLGYRDRLSFYIGKKIHSLGHVIFRRTRRRRRVIVRWDVIGEGVSDIYYYDGHILLWPITEAARSKAWTVFVRPNAGLVGSNPTEGMGICIVCVYSVFVLSCL
jgi:hypothetical protein